jgi:hypothetical protein
MRGFQNFLPDGKPDVMMLRRKNSLWACELPFHFCSLYIVPNSKLLRSQIMGKKFLNQDFPYLSVLKKCIKMRLL